LVATSAHIAIRVQVAAVYFHSTIGKLFVTEWTNGTAMFYWLRHPQSGSPGWLLQLIDPLLANAFTLSSITWGVLIVELLLTMGLLASSRAKPYLLCLGFLLHAAIIPFHGLPSFAVAMWGALILYLRPLNQPFSFRLATEYLGRVPQGVALGRLRSLRPLRRLRGLFGGQAPVGSTLS
jgi:antimicrobial peptide system SdpB family protein